MNGSSPCPPRTVAENVVDFLEAVEIDGENGESVAACDMRQA